MSNEGGFGRPLLVPWCDSWRNQTITLTIRSIRAIAIFRHLSFRDAAKSTTSIDSPVSPT